MKTFYNGFSGSFTGPERATGNGHLGRVEAGGTHVSAGCLPGLAAHPRLARAWKERIRGWYSLGGANP